MRLQPHSIYEELYQELTPDLETFIRELLTLPLFAAGRTSEAFDEMIGGPKELRNALPENIDL